MHAPAPASHNNSRWRTTRLAKPTERQERVLPAPINAHPPCYHNSLAPPPTREPFAAGRDGPTPCGLTNRVQDRDGRLHKPSAPTLHLDLASRTNSSPKRQSAVDQIAVASPCCFPTNQAPNPGGDSPRIGGWRGCSF